MPCNSIEIGGARGIVCTRGRKPKKCANCSRPSTLLCDFPIEDKNPTHGLTTTTCDKPICGQCARNVGLDRDYCRIHPTETK